MNEKCYIISYDLNPERDEASIHQAIKSYGTWAKINGSTWAILTANSAVSVRDYLIQKFSQTDRLFIVRSGVESAWRNVECSNEWLKKNL